MSWTKVPVAVLACTAALTCLSTPSSAAQTPAGVIAFDGDGRIRAIEVGGSGEPQEVVPADDFADLGRGVPDFSPDGTSIAFVRVGEDYDNDIWTMGVDGSSPTRLTTDDAIDMDPDWSPNGKRIVYASFDFDSEATGIYVMDRDGGRTRLVVEGFRYAGTPDWSPNGKRIAFSAQTKEDWNLYSVRVDGTGLRRLTDRFGNDVRPSWSPDGSRIAFVGYHRSRTLKPYVVKRDGTGIQRIRLADCAADCRVEDVVWSPDGSAVAVSYTPHDGDTGYLVRIDLATGTEEQLLTQPEPIRFLTWGSAAPAR